MIDRNVLEQMANDVIDNQLAGMFDPHMTDYARRHVVGHMMATVDLANTDNLVTAMDIMRGMMHVYMYGYSDGFHVEKDDR